MTKSFSSIAKSLIHKFNNTQNEEDFREEFFQDFLKKSVNSEHYWLYQILQEYDLQSKIDFLKTSFADPAFSEDGKNIEAFLEKIENLNPKVNPSITPRESASNASTPTASEIKSKLKTNSMLAGNKELNPNVNSNITLRGNHFNTSLNPELNHNITTKRGRSFETTIKPNLSGNEVNGALYSLKEFAFVPIIIINMKNLTKEQYHSDSIAIKSVFEGKSDNLSKPAKDEISEELIYTRF